MRLRGSFYRTVLTSCLSLISGKGSFKLTNFIVEEARIKNFLWGFQMSLLLTRSHIEQKPEPKYYIGVVTHIEENENMAIYWQMYWKLYRSVSRETDCAET